MFKVTFEVETKEDQDSIIDLVESYFFLEEVPIKND